MMATDAGSRMHVLDWVEQPEAEFLTSLNMLLEPTGATVHTSNYWRPRGRHDPSELRLTRASDPLVPDDLARTLRDWWLAVPRRANDPNWDFASSARFPDGRQGLVLIEAKAHVAEFAGEAKGKPLGNPENHDRIGRAIEEAAEGLHQHWPNVAISRDRFYQFSNRVAFSWKLASLGIPTVLIYLGFSGDDGISDCGEPLRDHEHWRRTVQDQVAPVFPNECWDSEIVVGGTRLWALIRSLPCARPSPQPGSRGRIAEAWSR